MTLCVPALAAVLVVSGLAACGGGDDDRSVADATGELGRVYCPMLFSCCTGDELGEKFAGAEPPVTDVAGCEAYYEGLGGLLEFTFDPDRAAFRPDELDACLDDLRGWSCDQLRAREPVGDRVCDAVEGLVEPGGACAQDMECASGYCEGETTCRARPGAGEACTGECGDGLYCKITDAGSICVAVKEDGQPCAFDNTCASGACNGEVCGPANECVTGLLRARCGPCTE